MKTLRAWFSDPTALLVTGVTAILCGLVFHYVIVNRVDAPFYDEWHNFAEIAIAIERGQFNPAELFRQWNEHRPLVLAAIVAVNTVLTGWDIGAQMIAHAVVGVVLVIVAALLVAAHGDTPAQRRRLLLWALIPVALLVLALRMRQIWIWGMQIKWTFGFVCFVGGLLILRRSAPGGKAALAAALCATGFTYTLAYGVLAWGLFPAVMIVSGWRNWRHYAPFILIGAIVLAQFLIGYQFGDVGVNDAAGRGVGLARDPIAVIWFAVMMLGSPLAPFAIPYTGLATSMGIAGLIAFTVNAAILWRRDRSLQRVVIPAALAAFGIGSSLIVALGRAHDFPDPHIHYPLVDRYTQPASMLWLGLLIAVLLNAADALARSARGDRLLRGNLAAGVLFLGCIVFTNRMSGANQPWVTPPIERCIQTFPVERNFACMLSVFIPYPNFDYLERLPVINDLSALRLTTWRDPAVTVPYSDVIELHDQAFTIARQADEPPSFAFRRVDNWAGATLLLPATSQIEFTLTLPDTLAPLTFRSAAILDLSALPSAAPDLDGVMFRVAVRTPDNVITVLTEIPYDPLTTTGAIPLTADLSAYRGQTIALIVQTGGGVNPADDRAVWLDPRLEVGLP